MLLMRSPYLSTTFNFMQLFICLFHNYFQVDTIVTS